MQFVIIKLNIILEVQSDVINSSTKLESIPALMKELNSDVYSVVQSMGFESMQPIYPEPSRRGGGWAFYNVYSLQLPQCEIRLIIDVRTADHPSQPDLATKNKKRNAHMDKKLSNLLDDENDNSTTETALVDIYYKERDWGVQYYIGKGDNYSDPVTSLDKLNTMLEGQLNKIIRKYS